MELNVSGQSGMDAMVVNQIVICWTIFFSTREKAEENLLKDEYSRGYSKRYEVAEIELDSIITKPEYRRNKQSMV